MDTEKSVTAQAADPSSVTGDSGIVVRDAVKDFDLGLGKRLRAVDGVSLEISDGEFVAVIGPSGCGKSTILRMIASLEQPTEGEVRINGAEPSVLVKGHRLGVAFQDHALLPWLNVWRTLHFHFWRRGCGLRRQLAEGGGSRRQLARTLLGA